MHKTSLNQVVLIGRLGQDPDRRDTTSGTIVVNLSIATTTTRKVEFTDQWSEETEWHKCVAFGKIAEYIHKYGSKGRQCYVIGRLQTKKWTDNAGVDHYTTSVLIDQFQYLDKREQQGQSRSPYQQQETTPETPSYHEPLPPEDDLPF